MTTQPLTLVLLAPATFAPPFALWLRRMRTRAALRELETRGLEDIGLTEAERQRECAKWLWSA